MKARCMSCLQVGPHLKTCPDLLNYLVFGPPVIPGPDWNAPTVVTYVLEPVETAVQPSIPRRRVPRWSMPVIGLGMALVALGIFRHDVALVVWEAIPR